MLLEITIWFSFTFNLRKIDKNLNNIHSKKKLYFL